MILGKGESRKALAFFIWEDGLMDRYNESHCLDMTAAIAIRRAERDKKRKEIKTKADRLTYKVGDIYFIELIGKEVYLFEKENADERWIVKHQKIYNLSCLENIDFTEVNRNGLNGSTIR